MAFFLRLSIQGLAIMQDWPWNLNTSLKNSSSQLISECFFSMSPNFGEGIRDYVIFSSFPPQNKALHERKGRPYEVPPIFRPNWPRKTSESCHVSQIFLHFALSRTFVGVFLRILKGKVKTGGQKNKFMFPTNTKLTKSREYSKQLWALKNVFTAALKFLKAYESHNCY